MNYKSLCVHWHCHQDLEIPATEAENNMSTGKKIFPALLLYWSNKGHVFGKKSDVAFNYTEQQECSQWVQEGELSPVFCGAENRGLGSPVQETPVHEREWYSAMNLAEATMLTREQDGAHGLQGEAERTESVYPGEGTAQGDLSALCS